MTLQYSTHRRTLNLLGRHHQPGELMTAWGSYEAAWLIHFFTIEIFQFLSLEQT